MYCPRCRQALSEGMRFCTGCGVSTDSFKTNTATATAQVTTTPAAAAATDPLVGRVLDSKYELGARLGEGGMGAVYRARRLHIGDEVAVKVLHQQYVRESGGLERFRREARSAALIRHTNVVAIHDFSEARGDDASAYIVMELVPGTSLRDLLREEGRLEPHRAVALMRDICAGVGVAHRQGIVHRDLKPDNIIVVPSDIEGDREMAKVLDFGLAKLRDSAAELSLTQTGAVMGTPYYMSPEQWRGESLDARSDVYSLGAMLFEMLSASPPFTSTSAAGLMVKHLNEEPPDLQQYLQIPPALEDVCRRALSKTPDERQADAAILSRELQEALTSPPTTQPWAAVTNPDVSPAVLNSSKMVTLPEQKSNRLKWVLMAGLLTLLIATVITVIAVSYLTRDDITGDNAATTAISNNNAAGLQGTVDGDPSNDEQSAQSLKGTWTGAYGPLGTSTRLLIKEHNRDKWTGVLEQGSVRVALTGRVDFASRKISFKETELINGEGWSLGDNSGEVSSDGRMMSGTGKDAMGAQLGISYQWSFSKR